METTLSIGLVALAIGAAITAGLARRHAHLWEGPRAAAALGARPVAPVGAPGWVALLATASAALGVATLVLFAPLGLVLAAMIGGHAGVPAVLLIAACLAGFGLGAALLASAGALYRRDTTLLARVGPRAVVHHLAVLAILFFIDRELAAIAALPCALGAALGACLARAARAPLV